VASAQEMINSIQPPLTETVKQAIVEAINVEGDQVADACRREQLEKLEIARAAEKSAADQTQQVRSQLEEAGKDLRSKEAEPDSLVKQIVAYASFAGCSVCEFVLTWYTLPFILSVPQYSLAGIMLALAPTTALAILEVALARLIEEPWRKTQLAGSSGGNKKSVAVMTIFLVLLSASNILMVAWLAKAREESSNAKRNLERMEGETEVKVNQDVLDRAIMAVSICVAIDGALFFLIGMDEGRRRRERMKSRKIAAGLSDELQQLETRRTDAVKQVMIEQGALAGLDARAEAVAEHYRARLVFQLEQVANRPAQPRRPREYVSDILAHRVNPRANIRAAA
jgi:hypothetical protein